MSWGSFDGLPEGSRIGPYQLLEVLGSGGLATVYKARADDGRMLALKLMHDDRMDEEQRKRIEREYRAQRRMDHPNIVRLFDAGELGDRPWLALEFVDGPDLETLLDHWAQSPPRDRYARAARITRALAEALDHIHGYGVFHRDLKPSNVLMTADGQPKLTDFGAVKAPDSFDTRLTMAGKLVGTVAFMAPEQITGGTIDARTDLYALGALLYLMLTGRRPVEADSIPGYLSKHLMEQPTPPTEHDPNVPIHLSRLAMRLLRKEPAERYRSAAEVIAALDAPHQDARPTLHGRDGVLSRMEDALIGLGRGEGGLFTVFGPPGSGRSALLAELEARARADGLMAHRVTVTAGVDPSPGIDAWLRMRKARNALLLIDDLDLASADHVGNIAELMRKHRLGMGLTLVVSAAGRPDPGPETSRRLYPLQRLTVTGPHVGALTLDPMSSGAVVAWMRELGFSRRVATTLGRRLHEVCGGIPGDILDQLATLDQQGWLGPDRRLLVPFHQLRDDAFPVPPARQRRILARIRALDNHSRGLLEALAVLASEADASLLDAVHPGSARAIEARQVSDLVEVRAEGFYEVARFRQPEVGATLYDALPERHRRRLHLRAAEALLARHRRRQSAVAEPVSHHLMAAGEPARAWPLLVMAAQRAARTREPRKALNLSDGALLLYEEAAPTLKNPMLAWNLHQQALAVRGEALLALKQPLAARDALREALEVLQAHPDIDRSQKRTMRSLQVQVKAQLGMALGDAGQVDEALAMLEEALDEMEPGDRLRFATLRATADAQLARGEVTAARDTWERARSAAHELGSRGLQGAALLGLGELELSLGQLRTARVTLRRAEALLREGRSARPLAICLCDRALFASLDGRFRVAQDRAEEAARLCREHGLRDLYPQALLYEAEALLSQELRDGARELTEQALAQVRAGDTPSDELLVLLRHLVERLISAEANEPLPPMPTRPSGPPHLSARHDVFAALGRARGGDPQGAARALVRAHDAARRHEWEGVRQQAERLAQELAEG
ncbi:MAG: protein kinase [Alphaproteobacteria bacterium]|nr:protein kinase [Alphaproteobacteria bacterium]